MSVFYFVFVAGNDGLISIPLIRLIVRVQVPLAIARVPVSIHDEAFRIVPSVTLRLVTTKRWILFDN